MKLCNYLISILLCCSSLYCCKESDNSINNTDKCLTVKVLNENSEVVVYLSLPNESLEFFSFDLGDTDTVVTKFYARGTSTYIVSNIRYSGDTIVDYAKIDYSGSAGSNIIFTFPDENCKKKKIEE